MFRMSLAALILVVVAGVEPDPGAAAPAWSPLMRLSKPGGDVGEVAVAIDAGGEAVAVWKLAAGHETVISRPRTRPRHLVGSRCDLPARWQWRPCIEAEDRDERSRRSGGAVDGGQDPQSHHPQRRDPEFRATARRRLAAAGDDLRGCARTRQPRNRLEGMR
jgi:hypothetical protein